MSTDRQIVRLMAAMILAIIAYAAPSAVQAHEGHAHHGHQMAATPSKIVPSTGKAALPAPIKPAVRSEAPTLSKVAFRAVGWESIKASGANCCQPGCKTLCCGTMACCAAGVLPGHSVLSLSLFRTVMLIPHDLAGHASVGPEALSESPRTLA